MSHYQYHIYYPEAYGSDPTRKWPLLLFLHGAGEKGNDLKKVEKEGLPKLLKNRRDFPFVVAWPQCPVREYWSVPFLNEWLTEVQEQVKLADSSRVYLTGLSMGAFGTWQWAAVHPQKFAAIIPICGGGNPGWASQLKFLPIWAFHGDLDDIVPVENTLEMVDALEAVGGNIKLTRYPTLKHDSWTETYNNPGIYDWLLQHKMES